MDATDPSSVGCINREGELGPSHGPPGERSQAHCESGMQ
jgi:hypothetical protein